MGPRLDQVAELTRGVRLPLPPIPNELLEVLAEGLYRAFEAVRVNAPATVTSGDEPEVTALMEARLNLLVNDDALWRQLVLCVARGKESVNFDGSRLENRPDLAIYLSGRTRSFPLVVEAKVLDTTTSKTVADYCDKGIRRFVEGEYAWANREALMIGYVRDGSTIKAKLTPLLSKAAGTTPPGYLVLQLPSPAGMSSIDLAYTRHGRDFVYPRQTPPNDAQPISIWHLWLA